MIKHVEDDKFKLQYEKYDSSMKRLGILARQGKWPMLVQMIKDIYERKPKTAFGLYLSVHKKLDDDGKKAIDDLLGSLFPIPSKDNLDKITEDLGKVAVS